MGIIAEGDMHNSAQADGRERLTALKAVEARLRRLGGLAFAADVKKMIAQLKLILSVPAPFPFWTSYLRIISSPNVSVHPRRTLCAVVVERLVGIFILAVHALALS